MTEKQKNFFAAVLMLCLLFTGSAGLGYLLTEIETGNYNLSEKQIFREEYYEQNLYQQ